MDGRKPGAMYFARVAGIVPGFAILTGHYYALEDGEELRTAVVKVEDGDWTTFPDIEGLVYAIDFDASRSPKTFLAGRSRFIAHLQPDGQFGFTDLPGERDGFIMDLRSVGDRTYAVGMQNQVYQYLDGEWSNMDDGIYAESEDPSENTLNSVSGTGHDDLYVVGLGGTMFHWDGRSWSELDSPTDRGFTRVLSVSRDEVYVCGYQNALYRGNRDGWTPLTAEMEDRIFSDMAWFRDRLYVCSYGQLFVLGTDDQLEPVDIDVEGPLVFYRMSANDDELWSIGEECVLQFDGETWTQHICPENT